MKDLRSLLLRDWCYAANYADSAIKQAYSILKAWRGRYIKGYASRKFARIRS